MRRLLNAYGSMALRWKILLPFVALSLLTWVLAAQVLGGSFESIIHDQGEAASRQAATAAARHLELEVATLRREVGLLAVEGQLLLGDRGIEEALSDVGPHVLPAFADTDPDGFEMDFVKVVDGRGNTTLDLRRNVFATTALDDAAINAAAREGSAAGGLVSTAGGSAAYVVGAAPLDLNGSQVAVLLVGLKVDGEMLSETGLPDDQEVFVVGPKGVIAATGPTSTDSQWGSTLAKARAGEVSKGNQEYLVGTVPVRAEFGPTLNVVAAQPAGPLTAQAAAGRAKAWLVLGLGLLGFIAAALLVSVALARPLRAVTRAAQDLAAGDLSARAPVTSDDEIGKLAVAFNSMGDELSRRAQTLAEAFDELKSLSETDALTGLLNHRAVHAALAAELERARRYRLVVSVVIIDVDHFKLINDTYGHPTGDLVLRQVADVLKANTRSSDIVGRHGGDEFMAILPETTTEQASALADKLRRAMYERPLEIDGLQIPIRLSLGTASFPTDCGKMSELLGRADANLYLSKRSGGDTVTHGEDAATSEPTSPGFDVLDALVTAIEHKDCYTRRHSDDVTRVSLMIADQIGLDGETREVVRVAGLLHDVGKIGIPDTVLRKPGRLTRAEYEIVKQHAALGASLIASVLGEGAVCDAVASHHEHWDGRGYPDGTKRRAIPLPARILAIADAYAAMVSDRPHRRALSDEEVLGTICAGAGTHFDPELAAALCLALAVHDPAPGEDEAGERNLTGSRSV